MSDKKKVSTKKRIVRAAGDIFGKEGYKAATIRKIAKAAKVNVAAINYHFKGKEGLYRSVLEDIFTKGFDRFPSSLESEKESLPEKKLQTFIHSMFYRCMSDEGWQGISGQGKLIAREFFDPTPAFEDILEIYIKPQKDILVSIVRDISGPGMNENKAQACAVSIIGQCIYYAFASQIIEHIAQDMTPTQDNLSFLAENVFRFSLGGIKGINSFNIQEKKI